LSDIEKERNQCDLFRVTIDLYVDWFICVFLLLLLLQNHKSLLKELIASRTVVCNWQCISCCHRLYTWCST